MNVYVCAQGGPVSSETLAAVQALLSDQREMNVDVLACQAQEVDVSLYIMIKPKSGYSFSRVRSSCMERINAYISSRGIGRDVLMSDISEILYHTEGVDNYDYHRLYRSDYSVSQSQYPVIDSLTIIEA